MIIRNDCVKEDTLTVEINGQCSDIITLPGSGINSDQIMLLMEQYNKCCMSNTMLLYQQQQMIKEILSQLKKCCSTKPQQVNCCKPNYPGQNVDDFTIIDITPKQRPVINQQQQTLPKPTKPDTIETLYSPVVDKNAFSIMGVGGSWTIVNGDIVSGGVSLKRFIPVKLGVKNGDRLLECITGYRVVTGGGMYPKQEAILSYQILNIKTGGRTIFEAGPNHFRSWFR